MSDNDSFSHDSPNRRWSFGAIAPGQAPMGFFFLILSFGASIFFVSEAIDGFRALSSVAEPVKADESPDMVQNVVLPGIGALAFLLGGGFLSLIFIRAGLEEESLEIDHQALTIEHAILSSKRRSKYLRRYIGDLRVAEDVPEEIPKDEQGSFNPSGGGSLVFQYGGQSIYFGPQVTRPKAQKTLDEILTLAPNLAQTKPIITSEDDQARDWEAITDVVSPLTARFTLESHGRGTHITIPARSSAYGRLFTTIWLVGWNTGIVLFVWYLWQTVAKVRAGGIPPDDPEGLKMAIAFLSFWLAVAIPASLYIGFTAVWSKWGRQVIEIDKSHIRIRNVSPLWRSTRLINRSRTTPIELRNLTGYFAKIQLQMQRGDSFLRGGWLECKEGYKKYHFGAGLTRRETVNLLVRLHEIDPTLAVIPDVGST